MKKTYINPAIMVVKIETRSIIATSPIGIDSENKVDAASAEGRAFDFTEE